MPGELNALGLRVLLSFLNAEESRRTVTEIARSLGEEKYTISRVLSSFEEMGWILKDESRKPRLSGLGEERAQYYNKRVEGMLNFLHQEGIDIAKAQQDAVNMAVCMSEQGMDAILKNDGIRRLKINLKDQKPISSKDIVNNLQPGEYKVSFVFFKMKLSHHNNISMANEGFENPCTMLIKKDCGLIQMYSLTAKHKSPLSGNLLRGRVQSLKYFMNGEYITAEQTAGVISIPLEAFSFRGFGNTEKFTIHGNVVLKINVSVGIANMPASEVMFTISI